MKYFYINDIKFNYDLEFDALNPKNKWKLNAPLIEYCETLGIMIPHYCYHKNLSIAGNCRMCLVELKKSPKPIVSCAMNARSSLAASSEIYTNSPLVKKARENIMEFLLLNHPLDCPICDQGGECDLQDQSLFFGVTKKRFYNFKRIVTNKNIGPIVKTVMTRCIHCTRCVRFAAEIASVEDLGVFGRGANSEIGTYVSKFFRSELSGNVIDICPVGALTSKPYPFIGRNWELKNVNSIDLSDGFGLDIQVFLKNNLVIKVLPGYNSQDNNNNWISDKTRFLFDGMFSSDRKFIKSIVSGNNECMEEKYWGNIFKQLLVSIYFYDHLNRHFFKINPITFVFGETTSIEVINMLQLLKKKFPFFQLRKTVNSSTCVDFEANLQVNNATDSKKLDKADVCLLINSHPRYEGSYLNLKLKKRLMKGNFKVFKFGNLSDSTFPEISIGNNFKTLRLIAEGNHQVCQTLKEAKNLLVILNSNIFERTNRKNVMNIINMLKETTTLRTTNWNGFNLMNNSLNSTGINLLNNFKTFTCSDLNISNVIYFINTDFGTSQTNKFIELRLLNYLTGSLQNKVVVDQNNKTTNRLNQTTKSSMSIFNYMYLPTNVFFETAGSYINTEGHLKKTSKIISSRRDTKDNWQLIRKLYSIINDITFISNYSYNNLLQFNCNSFSAVNNLTNLLYLNTTILSNFSAYTSCNSNQAFEISTDKYNTKKTVLEYTILKKNIEDFYINGFDGYSKVSPTMVNCSNAMRLEKTNFYY